jgi:hypothetical protein
MLKFFNQHVAGKTFHLINWCISIKSSTFATDFALKAECARSVGT